MSAGASDSGVCLLCLAGTYSTILGATNFTACGPCPSGTFSSGSGSPSVAACRNNSKYSCSVDGDCNYPACVALPGVYACNAHDYTRPGSPASTCGWGYYRTTCPAGYTCFNAGGGACTAGGCYLGTCPDPIFTCAPGTYAWVSCVPCPPGSYSSSSGATGIGACSLCSAGTYSSGSGAGFNR